MLFKGKNAERIIKNADKKQRFSLRKLSVGVASVLLGFTFAAYGTSSVAHAAEPAQPVAAKQAPAQTEDSTPAAKTQEAAAPAAKATTPAAQATKAALAEQQETKGPVKADNATPQAAAKAEQKAAQPAAKAVPAKGDVAKAAPVASSDKAKKDAAVDANKAVKTDTANKSKKDAAADKTKKTAATSKKANALKAENTILARKLRRRSVEDPVDVSVWKTDPHRENGIVDGIVIDGVNAGKENDVVKDHKIIVPNSYDFEKAGVITNGQKVYIDRYFRRNTGNGGNDVHDQYGIAHNATEFAISHNGNGKVYAEGNWGDAFNGVPYQTMDLANLDVSKVTNMTQMFAYAQCQQILGLEDWVTSGVGSDPANWGNMGSMFLNCGHLTSLDLSNWKTGKVGNMSAMFQADGSLTSVGDLSHWDVSDVKTMKDMFQGDGNLTSVGDLSNWDTSNVRDTSDMFIGAGINHLNISGWDLSNDGNVSGMLCLNFGKPNSATAFIDMRGVKLPTRTSLTAGDFNLSQYLVVYSDNDNLRTMLNSYRDIYGRAPQSNRITVDTIGGTSGGVAVAPQLIQIDVAFKDEDDFVSYLQQQTSDPYLRDLLNLDDGQYVSNYDPNNSNHGLIHDYSKVYAGDPVALIKADSPDSIFRAIVKQHASLTINYVDQDNNVVKTDTVAGNVGDLLHLAFTAPTGYQIDANQPLEMDYTLRRDKHQTLTIHVTATASVEIIYQTEDHTVIKRDTVDGLVGHSTHLTFNVPTGYEVVGNLPATTYTFAAKTNDPIVITVRPQTAPVTPTTPDTPPVTPTNPNNQPTTPTNPDDQKPDKPNGPDTDSQTDKPTDSNKPATNKPATSTSTVPTTRPTRATTSVARLTAHNAARNVAVSQKTVPAQKQAALPQTGDNKAGLIGLAMASLVAALGLAISKKREN